MPRKKKATMALPLYLCVGGGVQLHTPVPYLFEKIPDGLLQDRMEQTRGQLSQGDQDKAPLMQMGMGDGQVRVLDYLGPIEEYVEVDDARPHPKGLFPSHPLLDPLQEGMQRTGREGSGHLCHAIDEPILISIPNGLCFIEGGNGLDMMVMGCGNLLKGQQTIGYLIADV
jgi:hypothetical protein